MKISSTCWRFGYAERKEIDELSCKELNSLRFMRPKTITENYSGIVFRLSLILDWFEWQLSLIMAWKVRLQYTLRLYKLNTSEWVECSSNIFDDNHIWVYQTFSRTLLWESHGWGVFTFFAVCGANLYQRWEWTKSVREWFSGGHRFFYRLILLNIFNIANCD